MPAAKRRRLRHVAVFIESSRNAGRGLLEGVARYNREHGGWTTYYEPRALESVLPHWLHDWQGHGILARVSTPQQAAALQATGLPVIDLRGAVANAPIPAILVDNDAIAQLAFVHLRERGLIHFAYCGLAPGQHRHQTQLCETFQCLVREAGFSCSVYYFPKRQMNWEQEQEQLGVWLRGQPKPLGSFACFDDRGYQVLDACRRVGLSVPEEVAVLSVDDDPILCNLSIPPMSSIGFDREQMGYQAAAWLDRLMDGQTAPTDPLLVQPSHLTSRRSTDIYAFDDPVLNHVLRFIREHACEGIRVSDLLTKADLSYSELQRRFHRYLGRTPKEELRRVQFEQAKRLLHDTDLSLKSIAQRTGFSSERYFGDAFHREWGVRPGIYRQQHRNSDSPD